MRSLRVVCCLAAALVATSCAALEAPDPQGPLTGQALVAALREGGHVLYLRHTETTEDGTDDPAEPGDCAAQRSLTEAGRQDARELGEALRALDVPVGRVLHSPYCRTVETAVLAFGDAADPELGLLAPSADGTGNDETEDRLRELLDEAPGDGNTVLVGHLTNLRLVREASPEEGGTVVYRPQDGRSVLVGEVGPQGWQRLAADAG